MRRLHEFFAVTQHTVRCVMMWGGALVSAGVVPTTVSGQQTVTSKSPDQGTEAVQVTRWEVVDPELRESSGISVDPRRSDRFWTHNDSGDTPRLFAIELHEDRAESRPIQVKGAKALDWEDMASGAWEGQPWIVIGDVGDNAARRDHVSLYLLPQPEPGVDFVQAAEVMFRYADGPRDCEAVVMDRNAGELLLFAKARLPFAGVYRLKIPEARWQAIRSNAEPSEAGSSRREVTTEPLVAELLVAERIGMLPLPMITAADMSADGQLLAVTTYFDLFLFRREEGQTWREALAETPQHISLPRLKQIEAIAIDSNGDFWLTSEGRPMPLVRLRVNQP